MLGLFLAMTGIGLWAAGQQGLISGAGDQARKHEPATPPEESAGEPMAMKVDKPDVTTVFSVGGTYRGVERFATGLAASFEMRAEQSGNVVTGTYTNQTGDFGTFQGTVAGAAMRGRFVSQAAPGVVCDYESTLTRGGASYSGALVCNTGDRASFTGSRQQ